MFRICMTCLCVHDQLSWNDSPLLPYLASLSSESLIPGFKICKPVTGKPSFTKKQADLFFPPDFVDDFPVAMQVSAIPLFSKFLLLISSSLICHNLLNARYPTNTVWFMWSQSLGFYLFTIWRQLLLCTETELVQIQYFWQPRLQWWGGFMPLIGEARCYLLL
jgi:hypothetical protein